MCKATVAVYTYEAEQWKQFDASMVSLELVKCVHPFSYRLVGKTAAKVRACVIVATIVVDRTWRAEAIGSVQSIVDAVLDVNFQYSKSTDMFHNFQDGPRIWGFNFAAEDEAKMILAQLEIAREEIKSMSWCSTCSRSCDLLCSLEGACVCRPAAASRGPEACRRSAFGACRCCCRRPARQDRWWPAAAASSSLGAHAARCACRSVWRRSSCASFWRPSCALWPRRWQQAHVDGRRHCRQGCRRWPQVGCRASPCRRRWWRWRPPQRAVEPRQEAPCTLQLPCGVLVVAVVLTMQRPTMQVATGEGGSPAAAAAGGVPNAGQLLAFKEGLLNDFREELAAMRAGLIEDLVAEINSLP